METRNGHEGHRERAERQHRQAKKIVSGRTVRARGRKYKEQARLSEMRLPGPGEVRRLTEVQRALAATKQPSFTNREAGFLWMLGHRGIAERKRDQFFHDALRFCFTEQKRRFPVQASQQCLRALARRSTETPERSESLLDKDPIVPYQPGWQIGIEHRATRASYKRKAFKGALADALIRPEQAYESVVLAVLTNVPRGFDHLLGRFRNLY